MSKESKNPFEIRTELLTMAKDYYDMQMSLSYDFAIKAVGEVNKHSADYEEKVRALMPKPYTMGEVIDKANELYAFVSKK